MAIYQTENQNLENTRIILEKTYERNQQLATYIQLANAGIWGFIGFAFIEFFKDGIHFFHSLNIPIFLILIIILMVVWRLSVMKYQEDIEKCYLKILHCEYELNILEDISLKHNLIKNLSADKQKGNDTEQYKNLCKALQNHEYEDHGHSF